MNPNFERLLKVLWREQPDQVPFYEHIVDPSIMATILGRPMPALMGLKSDAASRRAAKKKYLEYLVAFFKGMGYDYIPLELGLRLFRFNVVTSHDIEPLGKTDRGWVDNDRATIANMDEFRDYEWPAPENAVDYELFELAREVLPSSMKIVGGVGGGVLEHVSWLLGYHQLSLSLRRDPVFVDKMFEKIGSLIAKVDTILAEMNQIGALRMGDDMGFKKGTLISPPQLRKYVFPWQKQVVAIAHKQGKPFILHSCGNLQEVMEDLIMDVKINAIHSFQDIIYPVIVAKEQYGDRIAILGGIDVEMLCHATLPDLEVYTRKILQKCMLGGGYALGSGNSITNYIKLDNYKAMLGFGRKYGSYS